MAGRAGSEKPHATDVKRERIQRRSDNNDHWPCRATRCHSCTRRPQTTESPPLCPWDVDVQNVLHRRHFKNRDIKRFSGNKAWRIGGPKETRVGTTNTEIGSLNWQRAGDSKKAPPHPFIGNRKQQPARWRHRGPWLTSAGAVADVTGGRDRRRPGLRAETEAEAGLRPFLWDMAHLEQS